VVELDIGGAHIICARDQRNGCRADSAMLTRVYVAGVCR
jgi:hypothetical protein